MIHVPPVFHITQYLDISHRRTKTVQYFMSLVSDWMHNKFQVTIFETEILMNFESRSLKNLKNDPQFEKDPRIPNFFCVLVLIYTSICIPSFKWIGAILAELWREKCLKWDFNVNYKCPPCPHFSTNMRHLLYGLWYYPIICTFKISKKSIEFWQSYEFLKIWQWWEIGIFEDFSIFLWPWPWTDFAQKLIILSPTDDLFIEKKWRS